MELSKAKLRNLEISFGDDAPSPSTDTSGKGLLPASDSGSNVNFSHTPLSIGTSSKVSPPTPSPATKSGPPNPVSSIDTVDSETPLTCPPPTADSSKTLALPEISDQRPLPLFDLRFTPRHSGPLPRAKSLLSTEAKTPTIPVEGVFTFAFGSQYKAPPKSFDFNAWSKISSAARLSGQLFIQDALAREPARKLDKKSTQAEFGQPKEDSKRRSEQAGEELTQETFLERAPITLTTESDTQKDEYESTSAPPRTPTTTNQPRENAGLLTPEATPEPTKHTVHVDKSPHPIERQEKDAPAVSAEEDTTDTPEATLEPINNLVPTSKESLGHALINITERRYKTNLSAEHHPDGLLTPPDSPQTSLHVSSDTKPFSGMNPVNFASSLASIPRARSPAVIPRKPLPNPRPAEPAQHESIVCERCGQCLKTGAVGCRCNEPDKLEWETHGASTKARVTLGRRLRHGIAKKVTAIKTKGVKMADTIVVYLEPDASLD